MTIRTDRLAPLFAALVLLGGCAFIESAARTAGMSERDAALVGGTVETVGNLAPIGLEEELEYGGAISIMIVETYGGLVRDEALTDYVNLVGQTVAIHSKRPTLQYYFGVLASDDIQAMAAPGGYVFITRGLLRELQDEAELAGVLAHEIAHVTEEDTLDIIRHLKASQSATETAGEAAGMPAAGVFTGLVDRVLQDYLANGLPRDDEIAADRIGAIYAARAGYDPRALDAALHRIEDGIHAHHGDDASFARTHPGFAERYRELEAELASLPAGGARNAERFLARTARIR